MAGGWDCSCHIISSTSRFPSHCFPSFQSLRQHVFNRAGVAWGGLSWLFAMSADKIVTTVTMSLLLAETSLWCWEKGQVSWIQLKRTLWLDGGEKKTLFCNFSWSERIIAPYSPPLLLSNPLTLNMWFAGRILCPQHQYFFPYQLLWEGQFSKQLLEIRRWTHSALKTPKCA